MRRFLLVSTAVGSLVVDATRAAEPGLEPDDRIVVYGRAIDLIGDAAAASEGVVGYQDFEDRPLARVGELVEVIPGTVATQHSGEGKANQYFLRGFNLDHGTDFSVRIDGTPVNLRTHGHGQGYLDLNFVIPELVERVDYRKGPYRADNGDFSAAGSARYQTYDALDSSFAEISAGEFGFLRGVVGASVPVTDRITLLVGAEGQRYDGPWALEQDLEKLNGLVKLTRDGDQSHYHVTATVYDSEWASTDQVPLRAVNSGLIDRFGFIDPDLGGETTRASLSFVGGVEHDGGARTDASAYVVDYEFRLFSNFTYFLDDPANGDEFEQRDERVYFGGDVVHERPLTDRVSLRVGGEARFDDISEVGLFRTAARERVSTTRLDAVEELSLAAWAEAEIELAPNLRAIIGGRATYFDAEVTAISEPANGGSADDTLVTPAASLAWRVAPRLELYASYGQGFHSNDVRGATITVDPVSGDPADRVPILVRADGAEIGARWETEGFRLAVAGFWLELESELVFVGDAGATEVNDGSRRFGFEATAFWTPTDWLAFDASGAWTDAEFDIDGPDTDIPGAVASVVSAGATLKFDPLTLTARLRHFGEAPLIEDGSVTSEPTTLVNLGARYDVGRATFGLDLYNLFDAEEADISYFFESQLPGEVAPVSDIHFHPVEPRQLRGSLRVRF